MAHLFANDTIGPLYAEQLKKEHSGSNWGSTGARYSGNDLVRIIRDRPYIQTVLDFGAGKGSLGEFITSQFDVKWTNYDPGIPEYNTLPDRQFDLVVTTDVLEHVEPDKLEQTIKTLESLTGKVLYNDIACYPTGKLFAEGPYKGQDLHLIIKTPSWWAATFDNIVTLQMQEFQSRMKRSKGTEKYRCMMIHERV